ncbi:hypothetical protein KAJ27_13820, partial [bacterium]|nr:hypothetical protein [bacterium]
DLPTGWDDAVVRGFRDFENNVKPNTVCALAGVVNKKARGRGFSFDAIKVMCKLVLANGLDRFILPVRPTKKHEYEDMSLEEYVTRKREDGLPEDPWVGVHQVLGGELIGYCYHSQLIEGSLKQWEEWAERKFEKSGKYKVKGAMQPVEIDIENNKGTYHDLAIWIEHDPQKHIEPPINTLNRKRVKDYLAKHIPSYMIPSRYSFVNEIPLTVNGKIDKKALLETLPKGDVKTEFVEPETEMEKTLSGIWSEILEIKKIGTTDNFFELGGHSLKAITLQYAIQKNFNVKIKVQSIFKYPTIKDQISLIENETKSTYPVVEKIAEKEKYPLSSAQKRLFIMEQMNDMGTTYNMPIAIKIKGKLNTKRLSDSLTKIIQRHQSLRTSFKISKGKPVQVVHEKVILKKLFEEVQEEDINQVIAGFVVPFDLEKAPLMRVKFMRINNLTHVLVMDFHHIIMDGISLSTFMGELWDLYIDQKLPELHFQYKDFMAWQQKVFKSPIITEQEKYWLDTFKNEIPVLDLITDFRRSASADYAGDHLNVFLDKDSINKLNMVAQNTGTTLFTIFLAALNVLLSRYTLQDDIVVGIPSSGRTTEEFEKTIGMFVNTLAIRSCPGSEKTFRNYLFEMKEIMLNALDNQDYQFDQLVEKIVSNRDVSRNPLFDVMFAYQGEYSYKVGEDIPLDISPIAYEPKISKFDLSILAFKRENDMMFSVEYKTSLFDRRTISAFGEHYVDILKEIAENCDMKNGDYVILSKQEKKKILMDFNETSMYYPSDKSLVQLFEDQVERTPDHIALINNKDSLTYSELNRKSNMFAWKLIENTNSESPLIGLLMDRSIDLM